MSLRPPHSPSCSRSRRTGHTRYRRTAGKTCVTQESRSTSSAPGQVPTFSPFVQTDREASQSYLKPGINRWHRLFWPLAGCSAASLPQAQEVALELFCTFCFLPFLCPVGECTYQSITFSSNPGFPLASPWAEGDFIVFPNSYHGAVMFSCTHPCCTTEHNQFVL